MVSSRRKARIAALQALYEADTVGHEAQAALDHVLGASELSAETADFARELVTGVVEHREEIDRHIRDFAPAWPIDQMPAVDRNVLRLAIFEILVDNKVPVKVGINEAVELAKTFGSDNSPKFVNGVLGSVSTLTDR